MTRELGLAFSNRSDIWQAPRQQCCRDACQHSERYDDYDLLSRGFETSRDLAVRRLTAQWIEALDLGEIEQFQTTTELEQCIQCNVSCNPWIVFCIIWHIGWVICLRLTWVITKIHFHLNDQNTSFDTRAHFANDLSPVMQFWWKIPFAVIFLLAVSAAVVRADLYGTPPLDIWMAATRNVHWIWITMEKPFVKRMPVIFHNTPLCHGNQLWIVVSLLMDIYSKKKRFSKRWECLPKLSRNVEGATLHVTISMPIWGQYVIPCISWWNNCKMWNVYEKSMPLSCSSVIALYNEPDLLVIIYQNVKSGCWFFFLF